MPPAPRERHPVQKASQPTWLDMPHTATMAAVTLAAMAAAAATQAAAWTIPLPTNQCTHSMALKAPMAVPRQQQQQQRRQAGAGVGAGEGGLVTPVLTSFPPQAAVVVTRAVCLQQGRLAAMQLAAVTSSTLTTAQGQLGTLPFTHQQQQQKQQTAEGVAGAGKGAGGGDQTLRQAGAGAGGRMQHQQ
jgi:hypothetical protein